MPRKRILKKIVKEKTVMHVDEKKIKRTRDYLVPIILISAFLLVLFFNSYFNYTTNVAYNPAGETIGTKFYLSGPDPYYNLRLCQVTLETGEYPFIITGDPLLNYPVGAYGSARPPLFNMIAVGASHFLSGITGMQSLDALGWCMLFLPAIYGALLVFPIYGIGKELFSKRVGLLAALFIAIIPLHVSSGHGSALSLFDHDSFVLLLFAITFYFTIKALKQNNDIKKGIIYSLFAGVAIAAVELTWVGGQLLFLMLLLYLVTQFIFDIFSSKMNNLSTPIFITTMLGFAVIITAPYEFVTGLFFSSYILLIFSVSFFILVMYIILKKLNMPWVLSVPILGLIFTVGLVFLYFVNKKVVMVGGAIQDISNMIFGTGIYGEQVSLTIGEAHTYGMSQVAMSIGPALYWFGIIGFILYLYKTHKDKWLPQNILFIIIFVIEFWMTTQAGRFLNDLIICVSIFSAFVLFIFVDKANFKKINQIRCFKDLRKKLTMTHIAVFFILLLVVMPNAFLSLDAAVPPHAKEKIFGKGYAGVFGLSIGQEAYWSDVCYWLSQQDTEVEKDGNKPGVVTWWDYGFYLASMSKHPTVADNYQDGLRCSGNFLTAQSEKEAVSVLIVRLVEGVKMPIRSATADVPDNIEKIFLKYFDEKNTTLIISIFENPKENAFSYNQLISPEYGNTFLRVDEFNAMYHDVTNILLVLSDEDLTNLYHDLIVETGTKIGYFGVEQRDVYQIFGVFPFLSDKGTHGYATLEDDWYKTTYVDENTKKSYTYEQLINESDYNRSKMSITSFTKEKDAYYNSMAYKGFFGIKQEGVNTNNRVPSYLLKHWKIAYISSYVSLLKYYEGAKINGTVSIGDINYDGTVVYLFDEYDIPHDYSVIQNGKFSLLGLSGNCTVKLFMQDKNLGEKFVGNITEDEAKRNVASNYSIDFKVDFSDVVVNITGVNETSRLVFSSTLYEHISKQQENISNNMYPFSSVPSSYYNFKIYNSTDYLLYEQEHFLWPGKNFVNITVGE
jgi:dolichyl-diphosphooligosaccharide--protein glycosyltransferase